MKQSRLQLHKNTFLFGLFALMATGMLSRCAQISMPQGGPRDSTPPRVVMMTPSYGTTNFDEKRIYIEFNEYVQLIDQQSEFFTSPIMKKKPTVSIQGRGIRVDIQDTLLSDQTYVLNFGQSVADNNEGNPYTGLRYVFSTGDVIDSLVVSGYTVSAATMDTLASSYLYFFDPAADSLPDADSTIFKSQPLSVARAFPNGIFLAENLKGMDYRVIALKDENGNMEYEPGVDWIGFVDSLVNPLNSEPFSVWYDTTRNYYQAEPQRLIRLFQEPTLKRQGLGDQKRLDSNQVKLFFRAPFPRIDELSFEGIDSSRIVKEYHSKGLDTMTLWFATAVGDTMPDTLRGRMIYQKQDSILQYEPDTINFKLGWSAPKEVESRKDRAEARGAAREAARGSRGGGEGGEASEGRPEGAPEGESQGESQGEGREGAPGEEREGAPSESDSSEVEKIPNPFKVQVSPGGVVNPEQHITFTFAMPLQSIDSSRIELKQLPPKELETGSVRSSRSSRSTQTIITEPRSVPFRFEQDSVLMRAWRLSAAWDVESPYELMIPAGAFVNIASQSNDTLKAEFTIESPDKFASFVFNVQGETPQQSYILKLLSDRGELIEQKVHVKSGEVTFRYVPTGEVQLRVIRDDNDNGEWDTGLILERRQAERVEMFAGSDGEQLLEAKENWELEYDIDMSELFAPETMESAKALVQRRERERQKAMAEERAQREKEGGSSHSHSH